MELRRSIDGAAKTRKESVMEATALDEALLDINEAARLLSVTPWSLRRWVALGYLKARRLPGGAFRFTKADLEAVLEARPT